jgi:putative FmdB family regulatory protein
MPFYEYQCKNCGHALEAMQKISDSPLKRCPDCGKSQLQRLMSAPVFRLKGGGWYETDFKGDKDTQRNLADRPEVDASKDAKVGDVKTKEEKGKEDGKGKDAIGTETKTSDVATAKDSTAAKEKPADKPAEKAPAAQKPAAAKSVRGRARRSATKSTKTKRRR